MLGCIEDFHFRSPLSRGDALAGLWKSASFLPSIKREPAANWLTRMQDCLRRRAPHPNRDLSIAGQVDIAWLGGYFSGQRRILGGRLEKQRVRRFLHADQQAARRLGPGQRG